jgi:Methylase involved in ubiquinone/menaquinone biosynthesis
MSPEEYARMYALEDHHWWFAARRTLLMNALGRWLPGVPGDPARPRRLLDVGCGTGATLTHLARFGDVVGVDVEPRALAFCRERGVRGELALATAEALPFPDGAFDAAVALDVLEHLRDDAAAVREIARVLKPGGLLFASVPAYPSLWSRHDVALMHRRRYTRATLYPLVTGAGFTLEYATHTVAALLPPIWLLRRAQRLLPHHGPPRADVFPAPALLNALLRAVLEGEGRLALRVRFPFGLSLFVVARRAVPEAMPPAR